MFLCVLMTNMYEHWHFKQLNGINLVLNLLVRLVNINLFLINFVLFILLVATTHIVNKPDLKTMSKNKKKKLKKKEKQKQKMLELTHQQIQVKFHFEKFF